MYAGIFSDQGLVSFQINFVSQSIGSVFSGSIAVYLSSFCICPNDFFGYKFIFGQLLDQFSFDSVVIKVSETIFLAYPNQIVLFFVWEESRVFRFNPVTVFFL